MVDVAGPNTQVIMALYSAADVDTAVGLMDPNCEWVESHVQGMPFVGTLHGTQEVKDNIYSRVSEFFTTFNLSADVIFEPSADVVVATGRVKATTRSGHDLDAPFVHVFDMDDGRIRRCINYHDAPRWLAALQ